MCVCVCDNHVCLPSCNFVHDNHRLCVCKHNIRDANTHFFLGFFFFSLGCIICSWLYSPGPLFVLTGSMYCCFHLYIHAFHKAYVTRWIYNLASTVLHVVFSRIPMKCFNLIVIAIILFRLSVFLSSPGFLSRFLFDANVVSLSSAWVGQLLFSKGPYEKPKLRWGSQPCNNLALIMLDIIFNPV